MGAIFAAVVQVAGEGLEPDFDNLSARLENEEERAMLPALLMSDLAWAGGLEFETLFKKATEALSSLRRKQIERQLELIQIEISHAEREQNDARVLELFQEKAALKRRKLAIAASPVES
jgi:hypothetical protein